MPESRRAQSVPNPRIAASRSVSRQSIGRPLSQVFSGHFDDHSYYHNDNESAHSASSIYSQSSIDLEKGDGRATGSTASEVQTNSEGSSKERVVDAPLEKARSTRSVRDPNLVCIFEAVCKVELIVFR